jgi:hypothetical protein
MHSIAQAEDASEVWGNGKCRTGHKCKNRRAAGAPVFGFASRHPKRIGASRQL